MTSQIPRYSLYGEEKTEADPAFVHCQPLFSKIERQDWKISPHRHDGLHQIVFLQSGNLEATLDGQSLSLNGPSVVSIPSNSVHGFAYSSNATGRIITIADVFLKSIVNQCRLDRVFEWIKHPNIVDLKGNDGVSQKINLYLDLVEAEIAENSIGRDIAVRAAVSLVLVTIGRSNVMTELKLELDILQSHQSLIQNFISLVAQHCFDQWSLDLYCQELGTTRKHLGRVCERLLGKSPNGYIHEQLVQEAQRRLIYTNYSVTEIGFDLGFKDPAYFSRFFRRLTGVSPSDYAMKHRPKN